MVKAIYISYLEINELETNIMKFIDLWVHKKKKPVTLKAILEGMEKQGTKRPTTIKSINMLLKKGYIRRAVTISNKSSFVQLRRV